MDFLLYIKILQNELTARKLPKETIHAIITQESALAETKDAAVLQAFFTRERLETLLAMTEQPNSPPSQEDKTVTIVPQGYTPNHAIRIPEEEKTILPPSSKATLQSLTDEATMVVISGTPHDIAEETTLASPDLKKLLSENETVRISEKDTVFFKNQLENTIILPPKEDETIQHIPITPKTASSIDTDATLPVARILVKENEEIQQSQESDTNSIPSETKKKESSPQPKPAKTESATPARPLSPETIRNPHPRLSFFWLAFLLMPSVGFLAVFILSFVLVIDLLFLLAFTAVMLLYLSLLLIPLFLALYSVVFAFLYWKDLRIAEGLTEFGLTLFSSGLSLLFGYLLYRPFVIAAEYTIAKSKSFNRKIFRLLRNLYRYSVKGAEKI